MEPEIKTDLEFYEIKTIKAESNDSERSIVHYISTPDLDRGRDIVDPKGIDFKDFEKTRTVFYNHNYFMPIGKNLWIKKQDEGVLVKTQFSESVQYARDVYALHKEGIINTWSIGFDYARDKDGKIAEDAIETDEKKNKRYIRKWILFEYSSAPLAMNPNALDVAKTLVKSMELKQVIEHYACELEVRNLIAEQAKNICELQEFVLKANDWEVQSVLFIKEKWTAAEAKAWLKEHDYKAPDPDVTEEYLRFRQNDPDNYSEFRTIDISKSEGIKAIYGKIKKSIVRETAGPALTSFDIQQAVERGRARAVRSLTGKKS